MKVLVACEFSGIVREAFRAKGHDAWSCDLLPSEIEGPHIEGDVCDYLNEGWEMMIAHPPCTYLSFAGNRYWNQSGRSLKRMNAVNFFMRLWNSGIPRIAIENPVGLMNRLLGKPSQIVHPFYFGTPHLKRTCLWLKNLKPLIFQLEDDLLGVKTAVSPEPVYVSRRKKMYFIEAAGSARERSRTFKAIAEAMASQWGQFTGACHA